MSTVIKTYIGIFILMFFVMIGSGLMIATNDANYARDYHAGVISEIGKSNYSPEVIAACVNQASTLGYKLLIDENNTIRNADGKVVLMEVVLKYEYRIPILNIKEEKQIRGFVR